MVSQEHRNGLYVTVPVYFCLLAGAAYWAHRRMERLKHDEVSEQLAAHYLGGRDFGPLLTAGTLFASLFSGYTVIGVPNQAYRTGWEASSWMPNLMSVVWGYYGTGLRLLRTSTIRNHQTPVDFITDRYQSQLLRYMIVFLQVMPTLVYVSAQVNAIKSTFNSIFELDADSNYPVIIIMALIVIFEWVGGLNSVALTDSIQALVMVASFVIIPVVIVKNFGGWSELDPDTYPQPSFYQTPSESGQWTYWQFSIVNFSFFTLPHLVQRTYAAKNPKSLKLGYVVMTIGPWLTTFVGLFIGTVGVSMLADENGNPTSPSNPFAAILEQIMSIGTFGRIAGAVAVTASLAAIMSTADSLIIAISQLVTVEIVYAIRPKTTPTEIAIIGKITSLVAVTFAILVGIFWDEGVSDLGKIQFSLSSQCVPAFLFGLFAKSKRSDIHPWCMFTGAMCSTIFVFAIFFGYIKPQEDAKAINAGIVGFMIQVTVAVVLELIRRVVGGPAALEETPHMMMKGEEQQYVYYAGRPEWDIPNLSRFGDSCLSPQLVWKTMEGIDEPMTNPWWSFLIFFVLSMCTPWAPASEPPLSPEGSESIFQIPATTYNGMPWWFFRATMVSVIVTFILLGNIVGMPESFPAWGGDDKEAIDEADFLDDQGSKMARQQTGSISSEHEHEHEEA